MGVLQKLGNNQGFVLDPILSLRQSLTLGPGQRVQVSLVLAAGETRQQVLSLMGKYSDPHAIDRAMPSGDDAAQLGEQEDPAPDGDETEDEELASRLLF